ncbi:SDR family NAD(P)-dependent oxidoreductase [Noviherbaspirillum sp. Root189]|uniref:SDR family NAD(P)-dependent oxidoreductase n=1 Tax=Noviherbaspirillum sp. Root189 TaxID=1736487 RepID=UPI00070914A5|nr:SDR family NAD(P)-dependent oxidoreductase [Noviherbaspirillum sp. Root189]KRB70642.1 oxidoreductase [Noviherbaspirillum sp. Root189]
MNTHSQGQAQAFSSALGDGPGRGRLDGRRILVVGAGQRQCDDSEAVGNGRAISLLFAREGAAVACADRDFDSGQETVERITSYGGRGYFVACDATDESQVQNMVENAAAALGGLDGVVINIGISNGLGLHNQTEASWDQVLSINLKAHMFVAKHAMTSLKDGGSLVFISSLASRLPLSRQPAYEASKAALPALCRAAALEGQPRGIRANVVSPGLIDTPMGRAASARRPDRATRPLPFQRQGTAWEVAHAALFLISQDASYINGHDLIVDGGLLSGIAR